MQGKYKSGIRFYYTKLYRGLLRLFLRTLFSWSRLKHPRPGYTVAIASHWRFPHMLQASLLFLDKQNLEHMERVICAIDRARDSRWASVEGEMKERFPALKLEFLYQSPFQAKVLQTIKWGWIDAWLSFCKCIAATQTEYIAFNDNEAKLLDNMFIEKRYARILETGDDFLGVGLYSANGIETEDGILKTTNMLVDTRFLRNKCRPIECFPHVRMLNGKSVDLDLLAQCQIRSSNREALPFDEDDWVHPAQVISQFSYLARNDGYKPPRGNNLFFIPYLEHVGGHADILAEQTACLESFQESRGQFLGYPMDMSLLDKVHMERIRWQIGKIENKLAGAIRPEVEKYLQAIESNMNAHPGS